MNCITCGKRRPLTQLDETGICSYCRSSIVKENRRDRVPAARRRQALSRARKLASYGIDAETYDSMLEVQQGRCAICGGTNKGRVLFIDHDHETGIVRALLCTPCNSGLGHFRDRADILRSAADYLDQHGSRVNAGDPPYPSKSPGTRIAATHVV